MTWLMFAGGVLLAVVGLGILAAFVSGLLEDRRRQLEEWLGQPIEDDFVDRINRLRRERPDDYSSDCPPGRRLP